MVMPNLSDPHGLLTTCKAGHLGGLKDTEDPVASAGLGVGSTTPLF
jgi:hypothetical protein